LGCTPQARRLILEERGGKVYFGRLTLGERILEMAMVQRREVPEERGATH